MTVNVGWHGWHGGWHAGKIRAFLTVFRRHDADQRLDMLARFNRKSEVARRNIGQKTSFERFLTYIYSVPLSQEETRSNKQYA